MATISSRSHHYVQSISGPSRAASARFSSAQAGGTQPVQPEPKAAGADKPKWQPGIGERLKNAWDFGVYQARKSWKESGTCMRVVDGIGCVAGFFPGLHFLWLLNSTPIAAACGFAIGLFRKFEGPGSEVLIKGSNDANPPEKK